MAGVVVMNYHGYLIIKGAQRSGGALYDLFDPWTGPLSTRFAATFVLTAGVGVTLMTASSLDDPGRRTAMQWRLVRRGLVLYATGLLVDFIWPGTILPFYGAMFALAALLITLRSRWVLLVGLSAALAGWAINWWLYEQRLDGESTTWLTSPGSRSPMGLVYDVFVNGTHPLFPWLAFFCSGIVLGRILSLEWWRPVVTAVGFALFIGATLLTTAASGELAQVLLSDDPFDRGIVYVASALGTALLAFAGISWVADQYQSSAVVDWLQRAGQMSLTIYLGHILVFNLVVDWLGWIEPAGIGTALTAAAVYWFAASALAVAYQRRYGRGPAERVYRKLTA